jgi:hypothetical protein
MNVDIYTPIYLGGQQHPQNWEVKPCGEGSCDVVKDCEDGAWGEWGG